MLLLHFKISMIILITHNTVYGADKCHKGGVKYSCCQNDGYGPNCCRSGKICKTNSLNSNIACSCTSTPYNCNNYWNTATNSFGGG